MGSFSIWHWPIEQEGLFPYVINLILFAIPAWFFSRAISKAGFSGWWALLGVVPLVNLVALWVFAFSKWPSFPEK